MFQLFSMNLKVVENKNFTPNGLASCISQLHQLPFVQGCNSALQQRIMATIGGGGHPPGALPYIFKMQINHQIAGYFSKRNGCIGTIGLIKLRSLIMYDNSGKIADMV